MYYNNIKEWKFACVYLLYISICIYGIIPRLIQVARQPLYGKATATPPIEAKWKRFPPGLAHSNKGFSFYNGNRVLLTPLSEDLMNKNSVHLLCYLLLAHM